MKDPASQSALGKSSQDQHSAKDKTPEQDNTINTVDPVVIDLSAEPTPQPEKPKQIAKVQQRPQPKKKQVEQTPQNLVQLSSQDIAKVLRKHQAGFQQCALSFFEKNPAEQEISLQLELTIASTGKITVFKMVPDHYEASSLGLCFQKKARKIRFPRHRDKSVSISFPLKFQAVKE